MNRYALTFATEYTVDMDGMGASPDTIIVEAKNIDDLEAKVYKILLAYGINAIDAKYCAERHLYYAVNCDDVFEWENAK